MHSKQTVKYICKEYPSGNHYFYKTELITHDSWEKIESLMWSALRPISETTFQKRKREGYKVEYIKMKKQPAEILPFVPKVTNT
ncbi:hypothetical protein [Halalkalibacter krulwichiae]|uniref:Uncharacterized protein n=1 Tax=Halalkalibacter krulwichiae TaxID=199441 RepID=A0A1X9M7P9_9BACI|nr:hypothetical protein [Halalkalibacter krulwichiae]ARK29436.1 hypothetical protein BkAM31D_05975 [Halalkalibacter krulwichiae]